MMATNAHSEAPGGAKAPFPPLQAENFPSQLFWLAICFIALYVLMSRLGLPRVGGIIAARSATIENDLGEANRLKQETESAIAAYARRRAV
jgi:F-type H+-transporting ATPase subunit b